MKHDANFVKQCLEDTGFLCRHLLGYDYDEDEGGRHTNIGKGGIVLSGKTLEIIGLLDDRKLQYKLVLAPRESRKSTIAQGFCVRHILLNPNIRICYIGRTDSLTLNKSIAIRAQLERIEREIVNDDGDPLFGRQIGDRWGESEFSVAQRTEPGLQNATFKSFSMDSIQTGGRFNIVVLDDVIDHNSVTNETQNNKSKDLFAVIQPLVARGGVLVVLGTIWAEDDLYHDIQCNQLFAPPTGGQVVCGAGVKVIITPEGKWDLEELPTGITFQHLTVDYLRQKLYGMSREGKQTHFCRQYLNEAVSANSSLFDRRYFKSLSWAPDLEQLSGFLLTDTAISMEQSACYSVAAYVGLDASDNIYLLDLAVGHWSPSEFTEQFFTMLEHWQPKVNHCGEAWEKAVLAGAYRDNIENDSRSRKTRLHTIEMPRPPDSEKGGRIMRLQAPMRNGHFFVVSTVPRVFNDLDGVRELWNPIGHWDPLWKVWLPSGELVDEFIKGNAKRDIPDAIAMILEWKKVKNTYQRLCRYKPWRPRERAASLTEQRKAHYHQAQYQQSGRDWWDQTLDEHGL